MSQFFASTTLEALAQQAAALPFKPFGEYCAATETFEFFAANDSFYAQSIDDLVTVYYSQATDAVVGIRLKKAKIFFQRFLKNAPGFKSEIRDHRIKVEHLFTAKIWAEGETPPDARVLTYRQLRDVAQANNVEADIGDLVDAAST
jgi:hypothetical protein